jgi:uncharacterized protein (TIGR00251 family)
MTWFRWDAADLILQVRIQPGASRSEFAGLHGEHLKVRIHAPAIEGRANDELLTFLCQSFATGKSRVSIERGALGRMKSLRVHAPGQLPEALLQLGLTPAPPAREPD